MKLFLSNWLLMKLTDSSIELIKHIRMFVKIDEKTYCILKIMSIFLTVLLPLLSERGEVLRLKYYNVDIVIAEICCNKMTDVDAIKSFIMIDSWNIALFEVQSTGMFCFPFSRNYSDHVSHYAHQQKPSPPPIRHCFLSHCFLLQGCLQR